MILQGVGILLLVAMAILFTGRGNDDNNTVWLKPYWWGILGLIGWAYLLCALIFLFSKVSLRVLIAALFFFLLFNIAANAGWLRFLDDIKNYIWIVGDGSMPALTMGGIVTAVVFRQLETKEKRKLLWMTMAGMAISMLLLGYALRPYWGISKIRATPSWVMICTALCVICFALLIYLVDMKKKQKWFEIIKPAGTSTLTCYLLPYIHYALLNLIGISLPMILRTGLIGITKSLLYALIIILVAGQLEKFRIRLRV
jgi:hypothetical protein